MKRSKEPVPTRPARASLPPSEAAARRERVLDLVRSLPEGTVVEHGRHASLEVRKKRWGWFLEDHHGDGRLALNCKAPPGRSRSLVAQDPAIFHIPKYLGHHGWVGMWLDLPRIDWGEVEALLVEAYRMTAPGSLVSRLLRRIPGRRDPSRY